MGPFLGCSCLPGDELARVYDLLCVSFPSFLEVYQAAMDLYGLIHARFILSPRGLAMMREKFLLGAFGMCQRILCDR